MISVAGERGGRKREERGAKKRKSKKLLGGSGGELDCKARQLFAPQSDRPYKDECDESRGQKWSQRSLQYFFP